MDGSSFSAAERRPVLWATSQPARRYGEATCATRLTVEALLAGSQIWMGIGFRRSVIRRSPQLVGVERPARREIPA